MRTPKQLEASRRNGAKSKGPTSPSGKQKSAQNSLLHGLAARYTVVLSVEDQAIFDTVLEDYVNDFRPNTPSQLDLVVELAICRWRLRRVWSIETALIEQQMAETPQPSQRTTLRVAHAWKSLANEVNSLTLLNRYETRIRSTYSRTLRDLHLLQDRDKEQNTNSPNEPDTPQTEEPPPPQNKPEPTQPKATEPSPLQTIAQLLNPGEAQPDPPDPRVY